MQVNTGQNRQKIALYGGAFDPVHIAHLQLARSVLVQEIVGRVLFIPAAHSPLKRHGPLASDSQRLEMLRLATADEPRFSVSDYEIKRGGVSYSYRTVEHFCSQMPGAQLFWILGADQFEQLDQWREAAKLATVSFLVFGRRGTPCATPVLTA